MTAATQKLRYIPLEGPSSDRVYLPASALSALVDSNELQQQQPLTFQLVNPKTNLSTHCGVLEFSAEEATVKITKPVADLLALKPNDLVSLCRKQLPRGTKVSLRPLESGYNVEDWKAVLEHKLQTSYTTLTNNDIITVETHRGVMKFLVENLQPENAVCVVDTDLQVDIIPLTEDQARESKQLVEREGMTVVNGKVGQEFKLRSNNLDITTPLHVRVESESDNDDDDVVIETNSRMMFIGYDHFPTREAFEYSSITGKEIVLTPRGRSIYISVYPCQDESEVCISTGRCGTTLSAAAAAAQEGKEQCSNCKSYISPSAMLIHSAQCLRNNIACKQGCGKVFDRKKRGEEEEKQHWHCEICKGYGDGEGAHEIHDKYFHDGGGDVGSCECGQGGFKCLYDKSIHRGTECGLRLHLCRFCHLLVPQEETSKMERMAGYTHHEMRCGSRTEGCYLCGNTVRLRDMESHMELHNLERRTRVEPRVCGNVNCCRVMDRSSNNNNNVGLCNGCFGPLYSSKHDPSGMELRKRIERRYYIQMTRGCDGKWCKNKLCKRNQQQQGMMKNLREVVNEAMQNMDNGMGRYWFCVDERTSHRKEFGETLMKENPGYRVGWCMEAVYNVGEDDFEGAVEWLRTRAVRDDEVVGGGM